MITPIKNLIALMKSFFKKNIIHSEKGINNKGYLIAILMPKIIPAARYFFLIKVNNPAKQKIVAGKSLIIVLLYKVIDG